ncbi:hypothetical protein [Komagataeibacter swingsii]|nr:hypothetical protein [Komagataeibacter swingsii]AHI25183.1 hypothetical protein H845_1238 [Komagataeibacter xylinus E25]
MLCVFAHAQKTARTDKYLQMANLCLKPAIFMHEIFHGNAMADVRFPY